MYPFEDSFFFTFDSNVLLSRFHTVWHAALRTQHTHIIPAKSVNLVSLWSADKLKWFPHLLYQAVGQQALMFKCIWFKVSELSCAVIILESARSRNIINLNWKQAKESLNTVHCKPLGSIIYRSCIKLHSRWELEVRHKSSISIHVNFQNKRPGPD